MNYYLYAFIPAAVLPQPELLGLSGGQLDVIMAGDVAVLVEAVDSQAFALELEQKAQDLTWLAAKAVQHDTIVNAHLAQGLIPLRFGTLLETRAAVLELLAAQPNLAARLLALRGKREFTVRVWADRAILEPRLIGDNETLDDLQVQLSSAPKGKAYLLERRLREAFEKVFKATLPELRVMAFGLLSDLTDAVLPLEKTPASSLER